MLLCVGWSVCALVRRFEGIVPAHGSNCNRLLTSVLSFTFNEDIPQQQQSMSSQLTCLTSEMNICTKYPIVAKVTSGYLSIMMMDDT